MKLLFPLFFFFIIVSSATGQDTTWFDADMEKVTALENPKYYEIVVRNPEDTNKAQSKKYFISGQLKETKEYSNYSKQKQNGKSKVWYEGGQLKMDIDYLDGKLNGQVLTYWENGQLKRSDRFEMDSLVEGKCMNADGTPAAYTPFQVMPEFPGGSNELMTYLNKQLKYPKKSRKDNIQGRVYVNFMIGKNGEVLNVKILRGVNEELNEEAMRVVRNMPLWKPGYYDGEAVRVSFNLPFNFSLR